MTGHGELLATTHTARFDEDDVAANGSPDETNRDAGLLDALVDFPFGAELRHAEEFAHDFVCDDHLLRFAFGHATRLFADDRRNPPPPITPTAFPPTATPHFPHPSSSKPQFPA